MDLNQSQVNQCFQLIIIYQHQLSSWDVEVSTSKCFSTISESSCTRAYSLDRVTSETRNNKYTTSQSSDENNEGNKSCVNIESLVEECFREFVEI